MRIALALLLTFTALNAQPFTLNDQAFLSRTSRLLDGMIGYWRLEESSGLRYDVAYNGNHLSASNSPTTTAGIIGNGSRVASASSQWLYKDSPGGLAGQCKTVSVWVKLIAKGSGVQGIVSKYGAVGNRETRLSYSASAERFSFTIYTNGTAGYAATANNLGAPATNVWYHIVGWITPTKIRIAVNNGAVDESAFAGSVYSGTGPLAVGVMDGGSFLNGFIDEIGIWKRELTDAERSKLYNSGSASSPVTFRSFANQSITIDSPAKYQVFQRDGVNKGNIAIYGMVGEGTHSIEARFNGGAWQTIASGASVTYSGTLTNQDQGQGDLSVRWVDDTSKTTTVQVIGIGDIFVIAGQSNASGRGLSNQSYSGSQVCGMLRNSYNWGELADPTDSAYSQLDAISDDVLLGAVPGGSVWPLLATRIMTNQAVPVAFIPCAVGSSPIAAWLQSGSATNRANLFGSMVWRGKYAAGGVKCVLFWQGESDAAAARSQSYYYTNYTNFSAGVAAALSAKVMSCKFQNCTNFGTATNQGVIRTAIGQAWSSDPNTFTGPDLSDIDSDDDAHLRTSVKLADAAERWWNAIHAALY